MLLAGLGSAVFLPLLPMTRRMHAGSLSLVFVVALTATWVLRLGIPASLSFNVQLSDLTALALNIYQGSFFSEPILVLLGAEAIVFALLLAANRSRS